MEISSRSYAKINLLLYNLGLRSDGYHELFTLFYQIDLYDTITLLHAKKTSLLCSDKNIPTNEQNLILKVDSILRNQYNLKDHYKITLDKTIPSGGGLGGGSSNAACYLQLVNQISNLNLNLEQMTKILAKVSSDSPFFLYAPVALGRGRGEILTPINIHEKLNIVIVYPDISVSTASVFSDKNLELTTLDNTNTMFYNIGFNEIIPLMKNDLEKSVFYRYPKIKDVYDAIKATNAAKAMMSGSGSTLFGVYKTKREADDAYAALKNKYPSYLVKKV